MSDIFEDEEESNSIESKFNKAADYLQKNYSSITEKDLLELYGLYKQITCGECNTPKPGLFNIQGKSKWNAWKNIGNLNKFDAMKLYVNKITSINPEWDNKNKSENKSSWVSVSVHQADDEDDICEADKTIFDYVKENNIGKIKDMLSTNNEINTVDETGLGLIHWATDRNAADVLEYLLINRADINLQDSEGQTALHYASSCGHLDCVKILIKFGADSSISDNDGATSLDVAFDSNVRELLQN